MTSQLNISNNKTRKEALPLSNIPTHAMFESRPFIVQSKSDHHIQQPDLKTSLIQAQKYAHHLSKTNLVNQSAHVEQPVQLTKNPRTRTKHPLSEGESDSENPDFVYRALRPDENPFKNGLKPPEGHDPTKTASQHITAGSKAKEKSPWVSTSRSDKVPGAWASENNGQVAKVRISEEKRKEMHNGEPTVYDLTDKEQASKIFPTGKGSSLNTAKASQEVVIRGGVPPKDVLEVYEARKIKVAEYKAIKDQIQQGEPATYQNMRVHKAFRTRTKAKGEPIPRVLLHRPPDGAHERLLAAHQIAAVQPIVENSGSEMESTPRKRRRME